MKTIKIFLASSEELETERTVIGDLVTHLNLIMHKQGIHIELIKWEYLNQSMEAIHKQEEYNRFLKQSDLCMVLYWTRFGIYTKYELDTAYEEHKHGNNPKKLYVYFKKEDVSRISSELKSFRDSFPHVYGHFSSEFSNTDSLKSNFILQLMDYTNDRINDSRFIEIRNSQVYVSDKPMVDLTKVPFAGNNEEYSRLLRDIKKTRKLLSITEVDDPDYSLYARDLMDLEAKQKEMEESLWETALAVTRLSNMVVSERLQHAIDLFNKGDNKGADALLNEEDIDKDADRNLRLMELGEAGRKGLKINIDELKLKIHTVKSERSEGWTEKVCSLHDRIIGYTERLYGGNSEELADALAEAAIDLDLCAKYEEALRCNQKAIDIRLHLFGENHASTALSHHNIAMAYNRLGKYAEALENCRKALNIWLSLFGENHPAVARGYANLGNIHSIQGDFREAMENFRKALSIRSYLFSENHPEVAASYNCIGTVYYRQADYAKALECFIKALEIRRAAFGENHVEVADSLNNVGAVYYTQRDYAHSLEYHLKALEIKLNIFGFNHPAVATSYNNIGFVYDQQGMHDTALENYEKALKIQLAIFGENNAEVARSLNNIAGIHYSLGNNEGALRNYEKALGILQGIFGEQNPDVATLYNNIGFIHQLQGNYAMALENLEKAQAIQMPIFGDNHPRVTDLRKAIADIKETMRFEP